MRAWVSGAIASVLWIGAVALPAMAFVHRAGQTVVVSETLQDDVYLAGGTVTMTGAVDGDVAAAGGTLDLAGDVRGGVLAAGGTLTVGGAVGRSLRAAAGTVGIGSHIESDAVLAGGTVRLEPTARIGRDLVVGGGTVNVSGTVGRNALIGGSEVVIGGEIHGDVKIQARRITLLPTARIGGALRYSADQPIEVRPGAQIAGTITRLLAPARPRPAAAPPFWLGRSIAELVALFVLGAVMVGVMPRGAFAVVGELRERFWRSLLTGFVLLVTVPVAAVVLVFTVAGIPLSVIGMLLYLATLYPGQAFVAVWIGGAILSRVGRGSGATPSPYWALLVGAVVLVVLFAIPFAGWVVRFAMLLAGFGALWATLWRAARSQPAQSAA